MDKQTKSLAKVTALSDLQKQVAVTLANCGYRRGDEFNNRSMGRSRSFVGSLTYAASKHGVGRSTVYDWFQIPEFLDHIEAAKTGVDDLAMMCVKECMADKNITAAIFWLKNTQPERFDDALNRQLVRQEHDKEMIALRLEQVEEAIGDVKQEIVYETLEGEKVPLQKLEIPDD